MHRPVFVFSTLLALCTSAYSQSICTGLLTYASREELQDDRDIATSISLYNENCQGSSIKSAKRTDIGLEAIVKSVPAKFNLGSGKSEDRLSNFCKVASEQNIVNERNNLKKSTVVREALEAFNRCIQLSNNTANFDPIIGARDISVSIRRGNNNVQILGVSYDNKLLQCSIATKAETKIADTNSRVEINDSNAVPVMCTRIGFELKDGVIDYPKTEVTILTDQANFKIPIDGDTVFPPATASEIMQKIDDLGRKLQSEKNIRSNEINNIVEEDKCVSKTINDRMPTRPTWSTLQCDRGSYVKGIEFTHDGGRDGTHQEAVRITCCPLKK